MAAQTILCRPRLAVETFVHLASRPQRHPERRISTLFTQGPLSVSCRLWHAIELASSGLLSLQSSLCTSKLISEHVGGC